MLLPNWVHSKAVKIEGPNAGEFTEQWEVFIDQLLSELQINNSNEGTVIPPQTTGNINIIAASSNSANGIRLIADSNTNELKAIVNGVVKTVTLS